MSCDFTRSSGIHTFSRSEWKSSLPQSTLRPGGFRGCDSRARFSLCHTRRPDGRTAHLLGRGFSFALDSAERHVEIVQNAKQFVDRFIAAIHATFGYISPHQYEAEHASVTAE